MSAQPFILTTFESRDGLTVATFGLAEYEWESSQGLYTPSVPLVGADYEYDQLGIAPAKKQPGKETLRYVVYEDTPAAVDVAIDDICSKCVSIGLGKLWATAADGSLRWAYARATQVPSLRWSAGDVFRKAVTLEFRRQSDWYNESITTVTQAVNASPTTFTITNSTGGRIFNAIMTFYGTWTGPLQIVNTTNGYGMIYSNVDGASNNDRVRFDSGANRVDLTDDGGATWTSDFANYVRYSAAQTQMMILEVGANDFEITVTSPTATFVTTYYPAH